MPENKATKLGVKPEYKVGKCYPPLHSRFPPGKSGNPKGRPKDRPNLRTMVERVAYLKVPVRQGEKTTWMPLFQAVVFGLGLKGAKGDYRSGSVFLATVSGTQNQQEGPFSLPSANSRRSAELFERLDQTLLSEDDMMELSRLAAVVDLGGGLLALNDTDIRIARRIVEKGFGKNITPFAQSFEKS
jgi:hypothetical protein